MAVDLENRPSTPDSDSLNPGQRHIDQVVKELGSAEHRAKEGKSGDLAGGAASSGVSVAAGIANGGIAGGLAKLGGTLWGSRKRKAATATGGVISLTIAAFSIGSLFFSGPLELVHIAQFLTTAHFSEQQDEGDERMGKLYRFVRSGGDIGETRLGALGSHYHKQMIADMEKLGLKPQYGDAKTFKGFTIDTTSENSPYNGMDEAEIRESLKADGVTSGVSVDNGKVTVDANKFSEQRRANKLLVKKLGYKNVSGALRVRVLNKYGWVTWHPLEKVDKKVNEKLAARYKEWKEKRETRLKNGVQPATVDASNAHDETTDGDKTVDTPASDGDKAEATAAPADEEKSAKILEGIKGGKAVGAIGGVAAAQGLVCSLKALGDGIGEVRYAQVVLPAIRIGMDVVTSGNQVMSNTDIDLETAGFVAKSFTHTDPKTGKKDSWNQAKSIQAESGHSKSGVAAPVALQGIGEGRPSWLSWTSAEKTPQLQPLCSTAGVITGGVISVGLGILSGGTISTIGGFIVSSIASGPIMKAATGFLAGKAVDVAASGADFGSIADYGSRLAANGVAMQFGGAPLSDKEVAQLDSQNNSDNNQDFSNQSIAYRLLNASDRRTLAGKLVDNSNAIQPQNVASTVASTLGNVGSIFKLPAALVSGKANADDISSNYDYGFKQFGFSVEDMDNPLVDDPYANADEAAKILDGADGQKYIDRAESCFGITIDKNGSSDDGPGQLWEAFADTGVNNGKGVNAYDTTYNNDECRDKNNSDWLRIRFFIFDTGEMEGWACFNGDDISCQHDGVDPTDDTTNSGNGGSFRISTYNVEGASHGHSYSSRLPRFLKNFETNHPDVVGFQEFQPPQRHAFLDKFGSSYDIYPKSITGSHGSENSIAWDKSKFSFVKGGFMPNLHYFEGTKLNAPYVKLTYIATGQQIYVLNTHDPADTTDHGNNAYWRFQNAKAHVDFINQLRKEKIPIFFSGDFNAGYCSGCSGPNNAYQNKDSNGTYCIITKEPTLYDGYDLHLNRQPKCPNKQLPEDSKSGTNAGGVDHVFMSAGVTVQKWFKVLPGKSGSDHPSHFFDITMPGGGSQNQVTVGTYNLLDAVAHPEDSKKVGNCASAGASTACITTRANRQAQIVTGKAGNPTFDVFGTQETSAPQYRALKSALSGYDVFPEDTSGLANNKNGKLAIWWDGSKFTKFASGYASGRSNTAQPINNPWVGLTTQSGKKFYVMSVHYANNLFGGGAAEHQKAANQTLAWVKSVSSADTPVFVVGDFNEHFDNGSHPSETVPDTAYCLLTSNSTMQNAYDMFKKKAVSNNCPTKSNPGPNDPSFSGRGKDQIYVTPTTDVSAVSWGQPAPGGIYSTSSDHTPVYSTISLGGGTQAAKGAQKDGWQWPVAKTNFKGLSNCYQKPGHTGIDLRASVGTPVYAAKDGTVVKIDPAGTSDGGRYIIIQHGASLFSNYQHNSRILVQEGQQVKAGDKIALSGDTGYTHGAHVHFSITTQNGLDSRNSVAYSVDPIGYLPNDRNENPCK